MRPRLHAAIRIRASTLRVAMNWGVCYIEPMPPGGDQTQEKTLQEVVDEIDRYPIEAFLFLQEGLEHAVRRVHGKATDPSASGHITSRHITGPQLCEGMREFELSSSHP